MKKEVPMDRYFVNKQQQANGDNEVHIEGCTKMPEDENRRFLGVFNRCKDAINEAKREYPNANGCAHCTPDCHTS
jgi:hypothetical protein